MAGSEATGDSGVDAHLIVDDLDTPKLSREETHHLGTVLRLRSGAPVGLTDGCGGHRFGVWTGNGRVEVVGEVTRTVRRTPEITVGFVPVKGDRPEWVVQKLTELGVDRIVVLRSDRSVVRWSGDRAGVHVERLTKVARAAVMQSRQVWVPCVEGVVSLGAVGARLASPDSTGALGATGSAGPARRSGPAVADFGGRALDADDTTVLVGPEGGWSDAERATWKQAGWATVGLGSSVLRAETAAVAAGVIMTALRDGRVRPVSGA